MLRSFIRDSEPRRTVRKLVTLLLSVLFMLVASDWIFGRLVPYITREQPFILRYENVPGVQALWDFSEKGIKPIVFTGSSQLYTGMSPHLFIDHIKAITGQDIHAVNVSVFGSVATIQRDLIRNLIIPNHPQIIIYGIEMRALVPAAQDENSYFVSDFRNKSVGYAVSRSSALETNVLLWLLQHSTIAKYRDNIREWLTGTRLINQVETGSSPSDDLGYAPFPNTFSQNAGNITTQFLPFTATDTTQQMMIDIGNICRQNGVSCILLNMPLHQLSYQYISAAEEALYQTLLKKAGLPIWDFDTESCRNLLGDTAFYNLNHLNSNGAEIFSGLVADVYAKVFYDVDITSDARCALMTS